MRGALLVLERFVAVPWSLTARVVQSLRDVGAARRAGAGRIEQVLVSERGGGGAENRTKGQGQNGDGLAHDDSSRFG